MYSFISWTKEKWKWIALTTGLLVVGLGTIFKKKKETIRDEKQSHDSKISDIDKTIGIFENFNNETKNAEAVASSSLEKANAAASEKQKSLSALEVEDLTRAMAEKYGLKNMDKRP